MTNRVELDVVIQKVLFYNPEQMKGAFGCDTAYYSTEIKKNRYGNFKIQGRTRELKEGETYTITLEGVHNDKYGDYYEIVGVEAEKLDTVESQNRFLKAIITEKQYESIQSVYPNEKIIDLIIEDKFDTKKVKGVKEGVLTNIKKKIEENNALANIIAGTEGLGFTPQQLEKINAHYQDSAMAINVINSNIYALCKIPTFGFLTIDKIALARGDDSHNENRVKEGFKYIIQKEIDSGNSWIGRGQLIEKAEKLLDVHTGFLIDQVNELEKDKQFYSNDNRITFSYIYHNEMKVLEHLERISADYVVVENMTDIKFKLADVESQQGFPFSDEQRQVILEGCKHGVMVVNGKGGVGKTTVVSGIIKTLNPSGGGYITLALSGKAASVLSSKGIRSSTIHRAIGKVESANRKAMEANPESYIPTYLEYDLIVLDEASMVDVDLFLKLLSCIDSGSKLIIVGDSGQLPAIGYGDVLRDLLTTSQFPSYELTQVHRQAAKSGILSLANDIRDGKHVIGYNSTGTSTYGELKDQTVIAYSAQGKDNISNDIIQIANAYKSKIVVPEDLYDFQVLVANKDKRSLSVAYLNKELQEVFNPKEPVSVIHGGQSLKVNDKVIHKGNSYDIPSYDGIDGFLQTSDSEKPDNTTIVYNGTMGIIKYYHKVDKKEGLLVQFDSQEGLVFIEKENYPKIQLAYALTIHSSQGSGIKHIVFGLDFAAYSLLSKQLVYTALTRAVEKGVALVEANSWHKAVSIDASEMRRTFLRDAINFKASLN